MNVEPAWMQGLTGKGVKVAVVDDGREEYNDRDIKTISSFNIQLMYCILILYRFVVHSSRLSTQLCKLK